jgi:UDP-N-acetylglucosamine 2-epimerase (non-hydrolysing)
LPKDWVMSTPTFLDHLVPAKTNGTFVAPAARKLAAPRRRISVPVIVGTRPEAIKLVPVILELRENRSFQPIVVATGQHHQMVQEVFDLAGIGVDVQLWVGGGRSGLSERVAAVMSRFDDFVRDHFVAKAADFATPDEIAAGFPSAVLVHGDTSSAMAAALAACHLHIPVLHVEAGLRTGGSILTPFPEELNRQIISCVASLHFAPTEANKENLIREDIGAGQVFVTGNTGIDALHWAAGLNAPFKDPALQAVDESGARIVTVTAHRRESWATGLAGIAEGIGRLACAHSNVHFVLPLHPNPRVRDQFTGRLRDLANVLLTEPLGYAQFAHLLKRSHLVITDSGGIQEEAPSLGKPVLVTRETTERGEGVAAGTLLLVGTDPDRIAAEGERLLTDGAAYEAMATASNPYGDGHAASRIVAALEYIGDVRGAPTPFGPGFDRISVMRNAGYESHLDATGRLLRPLAGADLGEGEDSGQR